MTRAEVGTALMLLTRVPAGWLAGPVPVDPARAVWAFPLVGAALGACGGAVVALGRAASMPPALLAAWALAATVLLSGALHEDGLADVADGFGGGRTRERKLDIMRDSRIGSYGTLALVLAIAIRILAIAALVGRPLPALIATGALSRGALAIPLLLLGPARPGGLGAAMAGAGIRRWACLVLALAMTALALPPTQAVASAAMAFLAAATVSVLAGRQVGGYTGDVLGASAVAAECAGLSALACFT